MKTERTVPVAYVTKYALSSGIIEVHDAKTDEDGYLSKNAGHCSSPSYCFIEKGKWFEDLAAAQQKVQQMIESKLRSLDEQISKLKLLSTTGAKVSLAPGSEPTPTE